MSKTDNPVQTALTSTFFGDISFERAASAILAGLSDSDTAGTTDIHALRQDRDLVFLQSGIEITRARKPGKYWLPNLTYGDFICDLGDQNGALKYATGIHEAAVALLSSCFAEADRGSIEAQAEALDTLSARIGLPYSLVIHSGDDRGPSIAAALPEAKPKALPSHLRKFFNGKTEIPAKRANVLPGKSLHAYFTIQAVPTFNEAAVTMWLEVQRMLALLLRADNTTASVRHLMRAPSVVAHLGAGCRIQTTLIAEPNVVDLDDLHARLRAILSEDYPGQSEASMWAALEIADQLDRSRAELKASLDVLMSEACAGLIRQTLSLPAEIMSTLRSLLPETFDTKNGIVPDVAPGRPTSRGANTGVKEASASTEVVLASGETTTIADFCEARVKAKDFGHKPVRCFCPFHESDTERTNAAIFLTPDGFRAIRCWGGCTRLPEAKDGRITYYAGHVYEDVANRVVGILAALAPEKKA